MRDRIEERAVARRRWALRIVTTAIRTTCIAVLIAGCARKASPPRTVAAARLAQMDTSMIRRICADADSVIAGRSACVLRDQGVRFNEVRKP